MQPTLSHIELGRKSTHNYAKIVANNNNHHPDHAHNPYRPISKCYITSPHRISEKTSPSKIADISHRTERLGSFENGSSFLELNDSHLSLLPTPKRSIQSPLRDRANVAEVSRQFVKVNFVNNSPSNSHSKTSSTHIR